MWAYFQYIFERDNLVNVTPLVKKLLIIGILSLTVHFIMTLLYAHTFDYEYWLMVMQNIETGNDLYGLDAYYYTPVWGYLLSFCDIVIELFDIIPVWGDRFVGLIPTEDLPVLTQATLASPAMNFAIKATLSICDIAVGYLLFKFVREYSGSEKKGLIAMVLWCFNPIIIYMSAGQGQFDTISTLLLLVTLLLLRRDSHFTAGIVYGLAVWLKIFPGFCLFLLVTYVWIRHKDDGLAVKSLFLDIAGFLLSTAVIFLPVILNGELEMAFSFLTSRTMVMTDMARIGFYGKIAVALVTMLAVSIYSLRHMNPEKAMQQTLYGIGVTVIAAAMILPGYQYAPSLLAFPIIMALVPEKKRIRQIGILIYLGITIPSFIIGIFFMGPAGFSIVSAYYGLFDVNMLCDSIVGFLTGDFRLSVHKFCEFVLRHVVMFTILGTWIYMFRKQLGELIDHVRNFRRGTDETD